MTEYFLASLAGYAIGRLGHIFGGNIWWIPHHWIFGMIIVAIGLFAKKIPEKWGIVIVLLGLGIFFSDFKDFIDLKTFEPENVEIVRFWGVD